MSFIGSPYVDLSQSNLRSQFNPANLASLNLPNVQAPAPQATVQQPTMNPWFRQMALARAMMGQQGQSPAVTPAQSAANAGSQLANALGARAYMQKMQQAMGQQQPQPVGTVVPGQQPQGFWGRLASMFGPGRGQAQPLSTAQPVTNSGQLGPANSAVPQGY